MNKDITEWLLDEGIEPLCEIVNNKNETIFLSDLLEKHLTEQLNINSVSGILNLKTKKMQNFKRIELENGSAMVSENYTQEIKKALDEMCKILIEAVQTEKLTVLKPAFTDGKFEEGQIKGLEKAESTIKKVRNTL